jgi:hypothetical protein
VARGGSKLEISWWIKEILVIIVLLHIVGFEVIKQIIRSIVNILKAQRVQVPAKLEIYSKFPVCLELLRTQL